MTRSPEIWPWVIALYEKAFRLAGHVVSLQKYKSDFSFSAYSMKRGSYSIEKHGIPPFSILIVNNKSALASAARQSILFDVTWVASISSGNDELSLKTFEDGVGQGGT